MAKSPIRKAKNGTYYFRANLGKNPNTGKQIQKYKSGFKTKKEALEEYSRLQLMEPDELIDKCDEITFEYFTEEIFLPWYKTQVKERTYNNRLSSIRKHFKYFYRYPVSSIQPIHVQKWQLNLSQKLSPSYLRGIQCLLTIALERAIILGLATTNAAKTVGNVKKVKSKVDFWTKEEFEKVISLIYKEDFYQHFLFISLWLLFMTGLRIGEATALEWKDIDFDTGVLKVDKTLYYKSQKEFYPVEPKTKASNRYIVLDDTTLEFLKEWQTIQQNVLDTQFIMSYNNFPTQKHTIAYAITRYAKLAGVHRIKIHALRHSHASLLISMGENPLIIKDRLGHEDIETTLGTYGHLYPNSNFDVAKKLNGVIQFKQPKTNHDTSPKNQFTRDYLRKNA